ncbi:MAG: hypothetical protein PHG82_02820 [Candidatus Gracilibacteria bacterium]|nr:hypothetical protein [Candidatus Gracilibacteria bacterium]
MANTKNKFLATLALSSILLINAPLSFADANKDTILANINSSISSIDTSKTGSGEILNLQNTVYTLSSSFTSLYTSLGLNDNTISYLVSLGKLTTDNKKDLITEYTALKTELENKYAKDSQSLNALKDEVSLSYTSLSSEQKALYQVKIDNINADISAINIYASTKTASLKTKYTSYLNTMTSTLKSLITTNSTDLAKINNFNNQFLNLSDFKSALDTNYANFKSYYLGGNITELTNFLGDRKINYSNLMKTQLSKMLDANIKANPGLGDYKKELTDYISFLSSKFDLDLQKNLDDNYSIIYSQTKMDNLNTSYNDFKAKYIDLNSTVKASSVLADYSGALASISSLSNDIFSLNTKLSHLSVSGSVNVANVKITLENQIIVYYNGEFTNYKASLLTKLKEKLDDLSVVNDLVDTKYSTYQASLAGDSSDTNFNYKINDLKSFLAKYEDSNNVSIRNKVVKIQYTLESSYLVRELSLGKYKYYARNKTNYEEQINTAMQILDNKLGADFVSKMNIVFDRIDTALANPKISVKNKYQLSLIKLAIRDYIYKNKM